MIEGKVDPPPGRQAASLAAKARKLALAHMAMRQPASCRWRDARALWPLFERN